MDETANMQYVGFWMRVVASLIDSILIMIIIVPILVYIYGDAYMTSTSFYVGGWDVFFQYVFPAIAVLIFWFYRSATPGKMMLGMKIVDADTGDKPGTGQFIVRYLGYYVSTIPLGLGLLWVAFDKRKQGWHDKIAGTVVVKST
jgi:uncharacterized RDD family membrane protein YckC